MFEIQCATLYLFIYGLFNDAVNSDYIASDDRMINE
jgi:hypothetical protein